MMNLNTDELLKDMTEAVRGSLMGDAKHAQAALAAFLQERKDRLASLAGQLKNKTMNPLALELVLKNEKEILEAELTATKIIAKAAAQKAANAALKALEKALLRLAGL